MLKIVQQQEVFNFYFMAMIKKCEVIPLMATSHLRECLNSNLVTLVKYGRMFPLSGCFKTRNMR